jgi:hypothetical protein
VRTVAVQTFRRGAARSYAQTGRHLLRLGCALKRTFDIDVLECPNIRGRMKLLAMITDDKSIERYLAKLGEATDVPGRTPSRRAPVALGDQLHYAR